MSVHISVRRARFAGAARIRRAGATRIRLAGAAALLSAAPLLAGCGSAAKTPAAKAPAAKTVTRTPATTTTRLASTSTPASTASRSTTTPATVTPSGIGFARCMRAHGVPNFPDPTPGSGIGFQVSPTVMASPSYRAAESHCRRFMPPGPFANHTPPTKQTMAKLLRIATCMRAHGIHQFPDPLYTPPRHFSAGAYQEITQFDGATLLFPANMDLQAPAYRQALSACGAPPLGLPH